MIKVYQTKFGGKDALLEEQGNCWQVCIASILELPLEEAFDCRKYSDNGWFGRFNEWLLPKGLYCIRFDHSVEKPIACSQIIGYAIMACMFSTLYQHVVIIKNQEVVHDPNPHAKGRLGECRGFYLILPIQPGK